jgi:hypothetical protein
MATKKAKSVAKTGLTSVPSRALEHGAKAFGAKYLRPGFALKQELDLAFALGEGSAVGPVTLLPDLPPGKKVVLDFQEVPRNVALAELRNTNDVYGAPLVFEENPAPLGVEEAQELLRKRMPKLPFLRPAVFRSIEAMVGPSVALAAAVEGLEQMPTQSWDNGGVGPLFFVVHGLLLRALPDESKAARRRLEELFKQQPKSYGTAPLDIMLHGREGIARSGYKYSTKFRSYQRNDSSDPSNVVDLCVCDDDGEFVAQQFAALWEAFQYKVQDRMNGPSPARLFFLGGEAALETELKVVEKYPGTKHAEAFESYRHLASPLAVKLIEKLAGPKSKVKTKAEAWLAEHA